MKGPMLAAVLALALPALARGQEGWTVLQGYLLKDLHAVVFPAPATGYAAGEDGIVLGTRDSGATWTVLPTGLTHQYDPFLDLEFPEPDHGFFLGGSPLETRDGGRTWSRPAFDSAFTPRDLFFLDAQTGFAVGSEPPGYRGAIRRTEDGGRTWARPSAAVLPWTGAFFKVQFLGPDTGYVLYDGGAALLYTADGGKTWARRQVGNLAGIYDTASAFQFLDASTGYALVRRNYPPNGIDSGLVLKTTDGGTTWRKVLGRSAQPYDALLFTDAAEGYVLDGDDFQRTTDGGASWARVSSGTLRSVNGFTLTPDGGLVTVGNWFEIVRTRGSSRTVLSGEALNPFGLNDLHFPEPGIGYAVGTGGSILATRNGGRDWDNLGPADYAGTFYGVYFPSPERGCVVGYDTLTSIRCTTDGGAAWGHPANPSGHTLRDIVFTGPLAGYAAGDSGALIRTADGGATWASLASGTRLRLNGLAFSGASLGLAVGDSGCILRTTDAGATWSRRASGTALALNAVGFADASRAFACGAGGVLLRSRDGGETWSPAATTVGKSTLFDVAFADPLRGWAAGANTTFLVTADGGESWTERRTGSGLDIHALDFPAPDAGYLAGGSLLIMKLEWDPALGLAPGPARGRSRARYSPILPPYLQGPGGGIYDLRGRALPAPFSRRARPAAP